MSTIEQPVLPADSVISSSSGQPVGLQNLGQAAQERLRIRERKLVELELRGEIKPATIWNLSPFPRGVESGLIPYIVPPKPKGKPFSSLTVAGTRTFPIYGGNQEMSDKSLRARYDIKVILPVEQLMEFRHVYVGETEEDGLTKQGGIVIFEGTSEGVTPNSTVRVPEFIFRKGVRYLRFVDRPIRELMAEATAQMKRYCMSDLEQSDHWADDPKTRANIQNPQRIWADFALEMNWIPGPKAWRNTVVDPNKSCPRCNEQFKSKTGLCKCGYVHDPLAAYMTGEIAVDHVRMQTLKGDDWKKVRTEEERRKKAQE